MKVPPRFGTFSIVAHDERRGEWGVAVQSKFIAVGNVVPWARVGVGAIATQALANASYGPDGLERLAAGVSAREVGEALLASDAQRDHRQVGIVDAKGNSWAYTGPKCLDWAGHETGRGFTCQGNILFGPQVVRAMARTYEATPGDLPDRLLAALAAGQREGGDRRGMQAAAILIVKPHGGYGGSLDRWVDIRVDDHPSPIEELRRIFKIYDMTLLEREDPATLVHLNAEVARDIQGNLSVLGYYLGRAHGEWDAVTQAAFTKFIGEHNFENKARADGTVWPSVLSYLKQRANDERSRRASAAPIVPGALDRGPGAAPGGERPRPRKAKSN